MALLPAPFMLLAWAFVAVGLPGLQTLRLLKEAGSRLSQETLIWAVYWCLGLVSALAAGLLGFSSFTLPGLVRLLVSGIAEFVAFLASLLCTEEANLFFVLWLVHPKTQGLQKLCLGLGTKLFERPVASGSCCSGTAYGAASTDDLQDAIQNNVASKVHTSQQEELQDILSPSKTDLSDLPEPEGDLDLTMSTSKTEVEEEPSPSAPSAEKRSLRGEGASEVQVYDVSDFEDDDHARRSSLSQTLESDWIAVGKEMGTEHIRQLNQSVCHNLNDSIQFDLTTSTLNGDFWANTSTEKETTQSISRSVDEHFEASVCFDLTTSTFNGEVEDSSQEQMRRASTISDQAVFDETRRTSTSPRGEETLTSLHSLPSTPEKQSRQELLPEKVLSPVDTIAEAKALAEQLQKPVELNEKRPSSLLPEQVPQSVDKLLEEASCKLACQGLIQEQRQQLSSEVNDDLQQTMLPEQLKQSASKHSKEAEVTLEDDGKTLLPEQLKPPADKLVEDDGKTLLPEQLKPPVDKLVEEGLRHGWRRRPLPRPGDSAASQAPDPERELQMEVTLPASCSGALDEAELQFRAGAVASVEQLYREELAALRSNLLEADHASAEAAGHAHFQNYTEPQQGEASKSPHRQEVIAEDLRIKGREPLQLLRRQRECRADERGVNLDVEAEVMPHSIAAERSRADEHLLDDVSPAISPAEALARAKRLNNGKTLKRIHEINAAREARRAALKAKQEARSQAGDVKYKAAEHRESNGHEGPVAQCIPDHALCSPTLGWSEEGESDAGADEKQHEHEREHEMEEEQDEDESDDRSRPGSSEACMDETCLPSDFTCLPRDVISPTLGHKIESPGRKHSSNAASENSSPRSISTVCSSADAAVAKRKAQRPSGGGKTLGKIEEIKAARDARRAALDAKRQGRQQLLDDGIDPDMARFVKLLEEWREQHAVPKKDAEPSVPSVQPRILVCVRKRPLNERERAAGATTDFVTVQPGGHVIMHEPGRRVDRSLVLQHWPFRFDVSFDGAASNEEVFASTAQGLVDAVVQDEASSTMFAYGQTGSGKTFSMAGAAGIRALQSGMNQELGMYQLSALYLFQKLEQLKRRVRVTVSFIEIYGPKVRDLLANRREVRLLEDGHGRMQVLGAQEADAATASELCAHIVRGSQLRVSKKMVQNNESSRSHAVLSVQLYAQGEGGRNPLGRPCGRFSLVDLAGNERGADNQAASSEARLESAEINKSLLSLKECIRTLARGRPDDHTPFRQSKITTLLRESFLNPRARVCVLNCISPASATSEYTLNTLRYASMLKQF